MGKKRVLFVDNDVDFVNQGKAALENNGFEVILAANSREGMGRVEFEMPDVILLGLMLEKHDDGFGFAKAVKADPRYKNIPILMVTAPASEVGCDFCQELDGYWMKTDDFLNKPITDEELIKRINNLLKK
jgi:DNA-binding response OmpR family regulator